MVERYLTPGRGFATAVPPASLPLEDPAFAPGTIGRGAVSPVLTWLLVTGLHRYGYDEQATRLSGTLTRLVAEHGPCEAFDAVSGAPIGARLDAATATVVQQLVLAPFSVEQISHF